jgi:hypothetical protein
MRFLQESCRLGILSRVWYAVSIHDPPLMTKRPSAEARTRPILMAYTNSGS